MRHFSVFCFQRKKRKRQKKRLDRSSIPPDCMRKVIVREAYIYVNVMEYISIYIELRIQKG